MKTPKLLKAATPTMKSSEVNSDMSTPEDYKEKYTLSKPCCVEDTPDAHTVWLRVEGQSFCVTSIACDTKEDAEWTRLMLGKALHRIAELEKEAP